MTSLRALADAMLGMREGLGLTVSDTESEVDETSQKVPAAAPLATPASKRGVTNHTSRDRNIESSQKLLNVNATLDDMSQNHIICMIQDILHLKDSGALSLIWVLQIDRVEALLH